MALAARHTVVQLPEARSSPASCSQGGEFNDVLFFKGRRLPALSPPPLPLGGAHPRRNSHSSIGQDSSSNRFSRSQKDKSVGLTGAPTGKGWKEIGVIEEEGLLDDEDERRLMPKCLVW